MIERFETKYVKITYFPTLTEKGRKELDALGRDGWIVRASSVISNGPVVLLVFLQRPLP